MLTAIEQSVFDFIARHYEHHNTSPTLAEIGLAVGIRSRGTVHRHVNNLVAKGWLEKSPGWRGVRPCAGERRSMRIPLLGKIAAGRPIEAIANEDEVDLAAFFLGEGRYALRVQGDSMQDAGILDGDTVIIRAQETADDGEIVVALVDDQEATLKRLFHKGDMVELRPENTAMQSMVYSAARVQVQGVVVGQMRSYR